jgi:predicted ATP-grasp superfamily ATP-dependent carboligase
MELVERAYGLNIFSLHLEALAGRLPEWRLEDWVSATWQGKGIVYARRSVTIPDTDRWLDGDRRDIPFEGDSMDSGQPICTVLAEGTDRAACWQQLVDNAELVWKEVEGRLED